MPSKNAIKTYIKNGIYHIYNRGVDKREIFLDKQDYKIFLYYLKSYLLPFEKQEKLNLPRGIRFLKSFNLSKQLRVVAYCLMPNHFHFMIKQLNERAIVEFMKRISNAYVEYFNKKYKRQGPLFQGKYKAVLVDKEVYFMYLSAYIHRNPLERFSNKIPLDDRLKKLREFPYSSYADYLGKRNTKWVYKDEIVSIFKKKDKIIDSSIGSYQKFVEECIPEEVMDKSLILD